MSLKSKSHRQKIRDAIVRRDGSDCHYCGKKLQTATKAKKLPPHFMQIEHIIPQAQGGTDDTENLVGSCKDCNRRKGTKNYNTFVTEELAKARRIVKTLEKRVKGR